MHVWSLLFLADEHSYMYEPVMYYGHMYIVYMRTCARLCVKVGTYMYTHTKSVTNGVLTFLEVVQ